MMKNINLINQYNSISEASKITGIHTTSISNACKGNVKTAGNYYWKYNASFPYEKNHTQKFNIYYNVLFDK